MTTNGASNANAIGNKVEAAYRRGKLREKRRDRKGGSCVLAAAVHLRNRPSM